VLALLESLVKLVLENNKARELCRLLESY